MIKIFIDRLYCDKCKRIINPKDVRDYTSCCPICVTTLIKVQALEQVND